MSKEAMKLALEALEKCRDGFEFTRQYVGREVLPAIEGWSWYDGDVAAVNAITALREALAQQALDKMAENARELGLDYEPAQQEHYGYVWFNKNMEHRFTRMKPHPDMGAMDITPIYTSPPAQQEPVAWMDIDENGTFSGLRYWSEPDNRHEVALYTSPPAQRTWVGLTLAEICECENDYLHIFARAIEAKLREKNT